MPRPPRKKKEGAYRFLRRGPIGVSPCVGLASQGKKMGKAGGAASPATKAPREGGGGGTADGDRKREIGGS